MEDSSRIILLLSARALSYPEANFSEDLQTILQSFSLDLLQTIKVEIRKSFDPLIDSPLTALQELYVATFDLKDRTGLYLTAHELGDSRKRGAALIKLQKVINEAGFERAEGELSDFMPMLYEFIAVAERSRHTERLVQRLAYATERVRHQLAKDNPYRPVFDLLMTFVFEVPTQEQLADLESRREEADLDEMPYPLLYG